MVDPKDLLELYKEMRKEKIDFAVRIWETIKFFAYIFIALLTAYASLITFIGFEETGKIIMISIVILPAMFIFSFLGLHNFKRECTRIFERIAIIKKIEEKLDFFSKRDKKNDRILKYDEYYLSDEMVELDRKIKNTKDFITKMMKKKTFVEDYGNVHSCFKWIFYMYMFMSIALFFIVILFSFNTIRI